jgi:hypothetical protein
MVGLPSVRRFAHNESTTRLRARTIARRAAELFTVSRTMERDVRPTPGPSPSRGGEMSKYLPQKNPQ